jgi:hypothetical protein
MVSTLIAAGANYLVNAFGISVTAATFAVSFALSQVVSRIFAENPESQQDMGVRQQVPPSQVNAIPIVYGDAYMGGTFVDAVLTTDQKTMYYVLAISSISQANATLGTAAGVFNFDTTKMYYGDRLITFDGTDLTKVVSLTDEAGNVDTKISGNLYINLYKSSNAGVITSVNGASAPSTVMGGSDIAVAQRWPATNRQMNNLAFAIVKLVYNRDADTTQLNPITFKVSHYPNGASVAKPADVWLDYITNESYGGAVDPAFVDTTCVATLNAYSDALITYTPSGGGSPVTQARYRINGVLDAGQTVLSNLDRIMSACDSWMTYNAALGQWSIVINKAETAAYAFTDNNIIGDIRVSATDITSSINQVEARFPFKENRDQAAFVNLETPSGLLYPNEPVNKYSITYDLVNDSVQAQYLANRLLEQAREDLIVSFSTTFYGIQVNAGDVVSVTNTDFGWSAKLFRVMKVNEASLPDGTLGAKLELNEYSADVYDDASITQYAPVANSNLASPAFFSALSAPTVSASYPSATIPSFDVTVTVPTTGRVTFGTLYYTTTPAVSTSWLVLDVANSVDNIPVVNGSTYTFANLTLPAATYYFTFTVGNETATSAKSTNSSAFVWNPVGMVGPSGDNGLTALTAYLVQSQSSATPTFTTPTSGATAPSGWSLTTPAITVGQVMWYIQGRYNSNAVTVDGVAANTTAWTGPIAASVFQDIRSDNWNGSTPPTYGTPATYGTAGYYIQQSTGDCYFNDGVFRADITTSGDATFSGKNFENTYPITVSGVSYSIDYSAYAEATSTPTAGVVRNGLLGVASASSGLYNVGVIGYGQNGGAALGIGVFGQGNHIGGSFTSSSVTGAGVYCENTNPTGAALWIATGRFKWGGYSIIAPAGSTTTFLRNDGTWATPSGGATPAGSNTQIQYNNAGAFGATGNLTYTGSALNAFGVYISSGNGSHFTNIAIGANVLSVANTTFAQYNTGTGYEALKNNTTASGNTAYGFNALKATTIAGFNTAVGCYALQSSTGSNNTIVGYDSASQTMTGSGNTAVGAESLKFCTSGNQNSVFGSRAGNAITSGVENTGIGNYALFTTSTGSANTSIGSGSLRLNTTGGYNTALGFASLYSNTTSTYNTAVGNSSLYNNTTGTGNVAVGTNALVSNVSNDSNVSVGFDSLSASTADANTAIGKQAGDTNTTGTNNTFVGYQARGSSATTSNNITLGNSSITTLRCQVTSITALSDARDKTDVKPIQSGLEFVKKLNPVSFTWNTRDGAKVGLPDMGFIAQELVEVQNQTQTIPNLVSHDNPEKLEAAYGAMFPILVKAVQELTAEVETLKKLLHKD